MNKANIAGISLIAGGAALVGAMSGWELGPYRLVLNRDESAMVSASLCAGLAIAACSLAIERHEARAKSRAIMRRLKWVLFRTKSSTGSDRFPMTGGRLNQTAGSGSATGPDKLANMTAQGARP